jgi:hypothetical protein
VPDRGGGIVVVGLRSGSGGDDRAVPGDGCVMAGIRLADLAHGEAAAETTGGAFLVVGRNLLLAGSADVTPGSVDPRLERLKPSSRVSPSSSLRRSP